MLMSDSKGRTFRVEDQVLFDDLVEIEKQLAAREVRPPRRDGLFLIDTRAHPDLAAAKERAFDAAAERYLARPSLEVRPSDWSGSAATGSASVA